MRMIVAISHGLNFRVEFQNLSGQFFNYYLWMGFWAISVRFLIEAFLRLSFLLLSGAKVTQS